MPEEIAKEGLIASGIVQKKEAIEEKEQELLSLIKKIEDTRKLFPEQRDYLYFYLSLENYIINGDYGYTRDSLRASIKEKFNIAWFSPRLNALFSLKEPEHLIFLMILLESLLKYFSRSINPELVRRIVSVITKGQPIEGIIITKEKIDFGAPERVIFSDEKEFGKAIKSINEILITLNSYFMNSIGSARTKGIFSLAFNEIKFKYGNLPKFLEVVRGLPEGILEEEKFGLVTREELEEISRRLTRIEVMKSEFANIAAHELKTPLVPIKGYLEILHYAPKKYGLNKKAEEFVDICLRNIKKLDKLVNDILDISKLEAGEMKFEMQEVDLVKLLNNTLIELLPLIRERGLLLRRFITKSVPIVYGDPYRLSQVVSNLIKNAVNFTEKGAVTVTAKLMVKSVMIAVSDTGIGISNENLPKLFTKFFQVQDAETRATSGTGLGLAICKEIIDKHRGRIWAESEPGKGSTFYFTLPVKR